MSIAPLTTTYPGPGAVIVASAAVTHAVLGGVCNEVASTPDAARTSPFAPRPFTASAFVAFVAFVALIALSALVAFAALAAFVALVAFAAVAAFVALVAFV